MKAFFTSVMEGMKSFDDIEAMKMFRIYRDVRFSKDKSPYKTNFGASFSRSGAHLRGGYYIHIQPGHSFIGTGFWDPEKADLLRIRKELEMDAEEFRSVLGQTRLRQAWGEIQGDALKTAPMGFDRDHPDIDLIKMKQYLFMKRYSDSEVISDGFFDSVLDAFAAIRPFFDLMSSVLTTDLNGESILD